jgi:probable rRNA maturation factor
MRKLNSCYRGLDRITDVLSFPMSDRGLIADSGLLGDIVVCVPRVESQAREYGVNFYTELLRLLVHGLLHLLGYDHERGTYQKRKMEKRERELLNALETVA